LSHQPPMLWILDVGHGNSAVIADERGTVVIDAGPGATLADFLEKQQIRKIDVVLISHADADHIGGLIGLVNSGEFEIGRVRVNTDSTQKSKTLDDLVFALQRAYQEEKIDYDVTLTERNSGEFDQGVVRVEILAPSLSLAAKGAGGQDRRNRPLRSNTLSVVIRLVHNEVPLVLLPGDIDQVGLDNLEESGKSANASILVFPHHGGRPGQGNDPGQFARQLCQLVQPRTVVFSVGRSRPGFPKPQVVAAVRRYAQVRIACTQLSKHCAENEPRTLLNHLDPAFARGREMTQCCAGTIAIALDSTATSISPSQANHLAFIKANAPTALCTQPLRIVDMIDVVTELEPEEGSTQI